jgi:PBP1b-binding outer membrane lipoprotein LpoB
VEYVRREPVGVVVAGVRNAVLLFDHIINMAFVINGCVPRAACSSKKKKLCEEITERVQRQHRVLCHHQQLLIDS